MVALILAAGYGTRMYPLTEKTPKALLKVGERTILDSLLNKIADPAVQAKEVVLVSNHRFADAFRHWFEERKPAIPWRVLDDGSTSDENKLGSVGDLAFAIRQAGIEEDLLVLGSDNLFEESLEGFMEFARGQRAVTLGAVELPSRQKASLYGVLSVDDQQRIIGFAEKPKDPPSSLVSTAVYFFPRTALSLVLEYVSSRRQADTLGSFISWLIAREPVFAYRFRGEWMDIGDIASYQKAQEIFRA